MKNSFLPALLACVHVACFAVPDEVPERLKDRPELVDISGIDGLAIELRYASSNNFTGVNLYGPYNRAYLHTLAAEKLRVAAKRLQTVKPGYKLLILDAARPRSVQRKLWDHVRGTDLVQYVSNPAKGSVHNFGFALDVSIVDANGRELDMGTAFDTFSPLSQPILEGRLLREGQLGAAHVENRRLLRSVMQGAGFRQLQYEWWHYDALPAAEVRRRYPIIE